MSISLAGGAFPCPLPVDGPLTDEQLRANPLSVTLTNPGGGSSSGLTNQELRASAVPVSGTFWQSIQPVSGSVSISGAVAVTGQFYQTTQPVSIASMPSTPVTGTFWQATQPVSIASTVNVAGAFWQSIQPVSGTVTANINGTVPVSGTFFQATQPVSVAATVATRDLKDNGRVVKIYSGTFTAATTEGMVTLTPIADGTAGATGTSFGVTAGKRFRAQAMSVSTKNAGAAGQGLICNLRMSANGAVTTSSPLVATCGTGTYLAIANVANGNTVIFPDGLELSGTMQIGISQIGTATAGNTVTLVGYEYS